MIKILFRSVEATADFGKATSDFIAFAQAEYPDLDVINIDTVPLTGRNTILKIVMADESSIEHNKGAFATPVELVAAYPTGELGDWAIIGSTDTMWVWDTTLGIWKDTGAGSIATWGSIGGDITTQGDLTLALGAKVDKVAGKGLSTNDYTTAEKSKLSGIEAEANKYEHPVNHPATIITEDATHRFATDTEKSTWNDKSASELFPAEIFEDGDTPPSEMDITSDWKRYRDFSVNDNAGFYVLKKIADTNPVRLRMSLVISNATAPAVGETINFEVSINGGAAVTLTYTGLGTEVQNQVVVTDFVTASFGAGNYTVSLERVAGTYAQEIGVMAVEVS